MTNEIFNNEIFNTVPFNHLRKFKLEICRGVTDNVSFTKVICNGVIGALTPDASSYVGFIFGGHAASSL